MTAEAIALATRGFIFGGRNIEKTSDGHIGKAPVAGVQIFKSTEEAAKLEGKIGDSARTTLKKLNGWAKNSKTIDYAGKAVKIASDYVNPLICVSAGIDIMRADEKDKKAAIVTNVTALTTMFGVEKIMKNHLGDVIDSVKDDIIKMKDKSKVAEEVVKFAQQVGKGKLTPIVKGVAFVVGSCAAYSVGEKFGKLLLDSEKPASA